jgi:hypothetical protein
VTFLVISTYSGWITLWVIIDGRWIGDSISVDFSPMVPANDLAMMSQGRRLPLDALVFDSGPHSWPDPKPCTSNTSTRPAYVLGRYTRVSVSRSDWQTLPEDYKALLKAPRAQDMTKAGYTHVYVDQDWYYNLDEEGRRALSQGNYEVMAASGDEKDFRVLLRVCSADERCVPNPDALPRDTAPTDAELMPSAVPSTAADAVLTPSGARKSVNNRLKMFEQG